jgi:hypothetical protein
MSLPDAMGPRGNPVVDGTASWSAEIRSLDPSFAHERARFGYRAGTFSPRLARSARPLVVDQPAARRNGLILLQLDNVDCQRILLVTAPWDLRLEAESPAFRYAPPPMT